MYRKLKRTWSNGYANYMEDFKRVFPELAKIDSEDLCDRLIALKMDFYYEKPTPVSFWIRLTMPFALLTMFILFVGLPVYFLVTGEWGYSLDKNNRVLNWLKSLRLQ